MTTTAPSDVLGYIFEIQKMSTEDGPGIRTTIFFKECPLKCKWCHNPESFSSKPSIEWFAAKCIGCESCILICPNKAISMTEKGVVIDREKCEACGKCVDKCPSSALRKLGEKWTIDDLLAEIKKDSVYYLKSGGGITASGGEALLQSEFLLTLFKKCKELGIPTALDTCGFLSRSKFIPILPFTDLILYDLKEIDPSSHKKFTGLSNEKILQNLIWLVNEGRAYNEKTKIWVRTPVIPEYTATKKNILGIGAFIANELNNSIDRWDLLAYNNLACDKYERIGMINPCKELELLREEEMIEFQRLARSTGVKNVHWSGLTKLEEK